MNTNTENTATQKPASMARKPVGKVQGQGHFGIKALIISLSLIGTMGGWGALAVNHIRDAQAKQIEDAQQAILALNDANTADTIVSAPVLNTPTRTAGNPPTVRIVPKAQTASKATTSVASRVAPRAAQSTSAPVLVARNDVPARVVASAPVLRDVQAQLRPVRRSRSSR